MFQLTASAALASLVLTFLAAPAAAGIKWAADVPMRDCQGVPCIDANFGTAPEGLLIIDTGNVVSIVDNDDATAIGFGPANMKDGQIFSAAHAPLHIGSLEVANAPVIAYDLNKDIIKGEMPSARGTLAFTALKDRILQLDFVHRRVRISDVQTAPDACASACAALHRITFGKKGPPILVADGFSLNGHPITAQIDTVYTGALLIYTASIDRLGLTQAAAGATGTEHFAFTDGGVEMRRSTASSVGFAGAPLAANAPLYFPTKGVHEPDALFDGTVGLPLMQGHVVTMDFHAMTMRVEG